MKQLNRTTKIVAKVLEIVHWVAAALMLAAAIVPHWMSDIDALKKGEEVSVYGFKVDLFGAADIVNLTAFRLFAIGAIIIFILMAMVFRNIHLIMKKSENATPFQKDNVRMVREIGIFSIAIPVVGLIMSTVIRLAVGVEIAETSVRLGSVIMGVIMLSLSQIFAYGGTLERDVDGLV